MSGTTAEQPAVSVLMPVYDPDPNYLYQAVHSILTQTWTDLELLVVEDPGKRSAAEVLQRFRDPRLRYWRNEQRLGLLQVLNRLLELARSDLVARLDADDVAEPERLAKQVAFLRDHPEITLVGAQLTVITPAGTILGYRHYPCTPEQVYSALPRFNPLAHPAVLFRKEAALAVGGYQVLRVAEAEDYNLWTRLAQAGHRLANLPEPLVRYRIHPQSGKSTRLKNTLRATLEIKVHYWRRQMDLPARLRMWCERLLLLLPTALILRLFQAAQYTSTPPPS